MTSLIPKSLTRRLVLGSLVLAAACAVRAGELPQATPESQHVSPAKLAVAEKAVQDLIDMSRAWVAFLWVYGHIRSWQLESGAGR